MLKLFITHKKSFGWFLVIAAVVLVMTGLGLDSLRNPKREAAIQVNEDEIAFETFYAKKRDIQERYRQMFGENYAAFAQTLLADINRQLVESFISDSLFNQLATKIGFAAGDQSLREMINGFFPGGFSADAYKNMLANIGMSTRQFENELRHSLTRRALSDLFRDAILISTPEASAKALRDETTFSIQYVEFDPAAATPSAPSAEEISKYYESHQADFILPARAAYQYVWIQPADVVNEVAISADDIEFYYSEHSSEFMQPERARARMIQLLYGEKATPQQMAELKEKAKEIHAKARAGEPFEALVMQHSADFASRANGGSLGWVARGSRSAEFDSAVFALKAPGIADLIEASNGFQIVKVEEYQAAEPKPLDAVRAEIEKQLREMEAPAFAAAKAQQIFAELQKSGDINAAAATAKAAVKATTGLLASGSDPDTALAGLTERVIAATPETVQLVDLRDHSVVVKVTESAEPTLASLGDVSTKIVERLNDEQRTRLARQSAEDTFRKLTDTKRPGLATVAKDGKLKTLELKDLARGKGTTGFLVSPEARNELFASTAVGALPSKVIENSGKFYVYEVRSITPPSASEIEKNLQRYRESEAKEQSDALSDAVISLLKKQGTIVVNDALYRE